LLTCESFSLLFSRSFSRRAIAPLDLPEVLESKGPEKQPLSLTYFTPLLIASANTALPDTDFASATEAKVSIFIIINLILILVPAATDYLTSAADAARITTI
jgi:hypothetical protein